MRFPRIVVSDSEIGAALTSGLAPRPKVWGLPAWEPGASAEALASLARAAMGRCGLHWQVGLRWWLGTLKPRRPKLTGVKLPMATRSDGRQWPKRPGRAWQVTEGADWTRLVVARTGPRARAGARRGVTARGVRTCAE